MPKKIRPRLPDERNQARFWKKVEKLDSGCWEWTGLKDKDGYGKWSQGRAHRVSYELHNGLIKSDIHVCHTCDNPSCVNPEHLWVGTNRENTKDRNAKHRQATRHKIRKSWPAEVVIEAHWRMRNGMKTMEATAEYGFSPAMSSLVKRALTWHFRVDA